MKNLVLVIIFLWLIPKISLSQTAYNQTLGPFMSVYSSTPFTFPATPQTTGNGKLRFSWGACFQSGPASILRIYFNTSSGSQQVVYATSTQACVGILDSVTISASVLNDAITTGGGTITGSLFITDYCVAGWGCSNFNDPEVFALTLQYTAHSTNFSASSQSICPGAQVQFTDLSINNPVSWQWLFPGGNPSTSTQQHPQVTYPTPGTYDVTLISSNGITIDTLTMPSYILVNNPPVADAGTDTIICSGDTVMLGASGGISYLWSPALYISSVSIPDPEVFPVNTTIYTVTVTDQNGCTDSDDIEVEVRPLPYVIAQANTNPICLGDTTMIIAVGAQIYQWSPSTGLNTTTGQMVFANPITTTAYTVTGTDFYGCVDTTLITIVVNPLPPSPSITQLLGTLYSSPSSGYQWYLNGNPIPGANSQTYVFTQNGTYMVMITDSNGCESLSLPFNVLNTGITNSGDQSSVLIVPNPSNGWVTIKQGSLFDRIEIMDPAGRSVYNSMLPKNNIDPQVDLSSLPKGLYLMLLMNGEEICVKKVLIH